MGIYEKLLTVQSELKAPKNQFNQFGKYNYRNAEDILEAVKPLCAAQKALIYLSDSPEYIQGRFYIRAEATFVDVESGEKISLTSYAREDDVKKGMDGAQITGASSSYARKYALGGLLAIDDGKDADTLPPSAPQPPESKPKQKCQNCGRNILDAKNRSGEVWKAADIAVYTKNVYGKPLCIGCMNQLKKNSV